MNLRKLLVEDLISCLVLIKSRVLIIFAVKIVRTAKAPHIFSNKKNGRVLS